MNADRLLAHYERIADAPDAIARLRRFILDLAVRGKLVQQDESDEPASELLKRIAKEKARLVNEGKAKRQDALLEIDLDQSPFELPAGWAWGRFPEVGTFGRGKSKHRPRNDPALFDGGEHLMIQTGDVARSQGVIETYTSKYNAFGLSQSFKWPKGTLCITIAANIADSGILSFDACFPDSVVGFIPASMFENVRYFEYFVRTAKANLLEFAPATAQKNINLEILTQVLIPLPPLAEQHRIVAKVDELMGLCDRLEAARAGRERSRDRLAAASLARLNAPDPETFQADARFALDALPALTTRPDQIKRLRQTILNLAVRGKLLPQYASDEPASELLKRIAKEKARLVKAGEISRDKPLPLLTETDAVFDLPRGWAWVRLGHLSQMVTSGSRDWAKHYANKGAIFVRMGNLSKDHYRLRLDHIQHVKPPADGEGTRTRLATGDILISITGDVGMLGLIPEGFGEAYINQHTAMVRPIPEMKGRYLPELFRSPFAQAQFNEPQRGIKNSFRLTDITQFVVPLPPLTEQHRIVAKVDVLMALCDRLEASLTATAATRRRLLDALLAEAFAPVDAHELEVAE